MITTTFDPTKPLQTVQYLRMSTEEQNARSPEQQGDSIARVLRQKNYAWAVLKDYVDRGVSGRLVHARPGFTRMMSDIRLGRITADAVLVDTMDRFGRNDQVNDFIRELRVDYGVLVLTADSGFADPTTAVGQMYGSYQTLRATDENRVKAHQVLRGKRDAVTQKRWPGGAPPFGYMLEPVYGDRHGRREVLYSFLVPDPRAAWVIALAFQIARAEGLGGLRVARRLNADDRIPAEFKPSTSRPSASG